MVSTLDEAVPVMEALATVESQSMLKPLGILMRMSLAVPIEAAAESSVMVI